MILHQGVGLHSMTIVMNENREFFKLDATDRKVLFWLMDNVETRSVHSWLEYIAEDYQCSRGILIDAARLYAEVMEPEAER